MVADSAVCVGTALLANLFPGEGAAGLEWEEEDKKLNLNFAGMASRCLFCRTLNGSPVLPLGHLQMATWLLTSQSAPWPQDWAQGSTQRKSAQA